MLSRKLKNYSVLKWGIVIACVLVAILITVLLFEQIDIQANGFAVDWAMYYIAIRDGFVNYEPVAGMIANPPWIMILLLPLGLFSYEASWALLNLITFAILILSVPQHRKRWLFIGSLCLLLFSYPSLAHAALGNVEGIIVAGVLLLLYGYRTKNSPALAAGILLAMAKPQGMLLLFAVVGVYILLTWSVREWLTLGGILAAILIPCMLLLGTDWLNNMRAFSVWGSLLDINLWAAMSRANFPQVVKIALWLAVLGTTLFVTWRSNRTLSRYKAGMLIAGSLLIAPYASGHSLLTLLAIGVIPFFQKHPLPGLILIMLVNVRLFLPNTGSYAWVGLYSAGVLLVIWLAIVWHVWQTEVRPRHKLERPGKTAAW